MPKVLSEEYKEIVKSKIIQAAIKVFTQKGYQGSSIDEIAAEADMSKSTLYTYFKSKLDILKLISNKQNTNEKFQNSFKGLDYPEALEEFFKMVISIQEGLNVPFELLTLSLHDESLRKTYCEGYNEKFDSFEIFLQKQQQKGIIRDDVNANTLAQLLMALSMDISMQLVFGFDKVMIHEKWTNSVLAILEKK